MILSKFSDRVAGVDAQGQFAEAHRWGTILAYLLLGAYLFLGLRLLKSIEREMEVRTGRS